MIERSKESAKAERATRLQAALRENLRRRKMQAKERTKERAKERVRSTDPTHDSAGIVPEKRKE